MIDAVRSEEEFRALADAALDRELDRARVGLTPSVSSKAAARFLGVHFDTLGQWRRRTPPLGPPFQKGAGDNQGAANQHVRYRFVDLEEWQSARTGKTVKERRLMDELERVRQRARELEMELELQSLREQVARMTKKAGRVLALETAKECLQTMHHWVVAEGRVLGHVLTVPTEALGAALEAGDVLDATLNEVLGMPWVNSDKRDVFAQQMDQALGELAGRLAQERSAQRSRDLDAKLPPARESTRTPF
ncbi:nucleotide-binding protein [Xanthomonas campestris pv. mirabilis]|uniref:nucleotide-binding protein n=1 Tax=Xanthomonas euvesicatoria TaxID=456327 RepID=UPI001C45D33B|nr:nucleotide-binding protein [Xanthomonas euvesicatoria]MBV6852693.1 nucleotide-binding protein [Xanthomonas campestris pv. mirabilis]